MESVALVLEVLLPLAVGALVNRYVAVAARSLLEEICGTSVRASFWMRVTTLAVFLTPPALALAFAGSGGNGNLDALLRRTLLLSLLGALLAVGAVARVLFRRVPAAAPNCRKDATT
jgi:hypothetical protein